MATLRMVVGIVRSYGTVAVEKIHRRLYKNVQSVR